MKFTPKIIKEFSLYLFIRPQERLVKLLKMENLGSIGLENRKLVQQSFTYSNL